MGFAGMNLSDLNILDFRGQNGFPNDERGICYEFNQSVQYFDRWTNIPRKVHKRYVVRTDTTNQGWRIDHLPPIGPAEAVRGLSDNKAYWNTAQEAATALGEVLDEIRTKTTTIVFGS